MMLNEKSSNSYELSTDRAREVLRLLGVAIEQRAGLVGEQDDLVENQIPVGVAQGGFEHALFLFMIVPNDRGVKSSALWARSKDAFCTRPELFDLNWIANRFSENRAGLASILMKLIKPRYVNHSASAWIENAVRLARDFGGDPRALFAASTDAREVARLIRSYRGFGPKTGGMMLRAAIGLGWASTEHLEEVEVPVDVHDVRISLQTGILNVAEEQKQRFLTDGYSALAPVVRRVLTQICADEKVSWLNIDRACRTATNPRWKRAIQ